MVVIQVLCEMALLAITVLGVAVVAGYLGLPILGIAAFGATGAYSAVLATTNGHASPWTALVVGFIAGGGTALISGSVLVTLRRDYFALGTFIFNICVIQLALNLPVTRGPRGISGVEPISLAGVPFTHPPQWVGLLAALVLVGYLVFERTVNSRLGRQIRAIRDDEILSLSLGTNTYTIKLFVFTIAGAFAGLAGALSAQYVTYIDPTTFSVEASINALLVVILGGLGNLGVSLVACFVFTALHALLTMPPWPPGFVGPLEQAIFGIALLLLVVHQPKGIAGHVAPQ